jgi:hypothetical protein
VAVDLIETTLVSFVAFVFIGGTMAYVAAPDLEVLDGVPVDDAQGPTCPDSDECQDVEPTTSDESDDNDHDEEDERDDDHRDDRRGKGKKGDRD